MLRDGYFWFLFAVLTVLAALHFFGLYSGAYARLFWWDIIMHFLGGIWVGGMTLWLFLRSVGRTGATVARAYCIGFAAALAVGIAWEIFEVIADPLLSGEAGYVLDTTKDLFMDSAGGLAAGGLFLWLHKKR